MIQSEQIQRPRLIWVVDDREINRDAPGVIPEDGCEILCRRRLKR